MASHTGATTNETTVPTPSPSTPTELARGASLGRYVILNLVGWGAVGEVYAAYDPELDRKVAVKVLRVREGQHMAKLVARLQREAKAMARVSHPNVIAVHDAGVSDGRPFLTMEFVRGTTLKLWQEVGSHDWREIRDVYLAAGRGLAAAHSAGIVHRDFKPANVLVSHDATMVKVTDFGIARALDAEDEAYDEAELDAATPTSTPSISSSITETGAILGTPSYMSPEQFRAEPTDARTDQFSFCAALYEALYGVHSHVGATFDELSEAVLAGRVTELPKGTRVPAWIRQALLRGLSVDPASRYPSLEDLLGALTQDPAAKRRRALLVAGIIALGATVFAVAGRATNRAPVPQPCTGGGAEVGEVWNGTAATVAGQAFHGTGAVFADEAWRHTRDALDDYGRRWAAAHRQACEATRVRGEQSEQVMTLRMVCLESRRTQLRELVGVFEHADRGVVERSISAAGALPSIEACDDVTSLTEIKALPGDKAMVDRIAGLRDELSAIHAQFDAGRYAVALDRLKQLEPVARATGYEPLLAEVLWLLGATQNTMGDWQGAADTLREAAWMAERSRDDATKAQAEVGLVITSTNLGRLDEGALWSDAAAATLARHGSDEMLEARWNIAAAALRGFQERYDEAIAHARRAVALAERHVSASPYLLVHSCTELGHELTHGKGSPEGLPYYERADTTIVASYGPVHPLRVFVASSRVGALLLLERYDEAVAVGRAMLPVAVQAVPTSSPHLGTLLDNLGDALSWSGHYDEALEVIDRAIEVSVEGHDEVRRGAALTTRAHVFVMTTRYAEALAAADEALQAFEGHLPPDDEASAETHVARAQALLGTGDAKRALAAAERALAIFTRVPRQEPLLRRMTADAQFAVARALRQTGAQRARAVALATQARDGYAADGDADDATTAATWLAILR